MHSIHDALGTELQVKTRSPSLLSPVTSSSSVSWHGVVCRTQAGAFLRTDPLGRGLWVRVTVFLWSWQREQSRGEREGGETCIQLGAELLIWVQLFVIPWAVAHQAPLSMGFPGREYWSGLPSPSPGDLPNSGFEPKSPVPPKLAGAFFTTSTTQEAHIPYSYSYV